MFRIGKFNDKCTAAIVTRTLSTNRAASYCGILQTRTRPPVTAGRGPADLEVLHPVPGYWQAAGPWAGRGPWRAARGGRRDSGGWARAPCAGPVRSYAECTSSAGRGRPVAAQASRRQGPGPVEARVARRAAGAGILEAGPERRAWAGPLLRGMH